MDNLYVRLLSVEKEALLTCMLTLLYFQSSKKLV